MPYSGLGPGAPLFFPPLQQTTYFSNDPRFEPARFGWFIGSDTLTKHTLTLTDTWRPTRYVTVTPSISHVWAKAENSVGSTVINTQTWAPGLAGVWDATHDGRTALRASGSSYVDVDVGAIARHTIGGMTQYRCGYNAATGAFDVNCVYSGGKSLNTIGSPCGPAGVDEQGRPCGQELKVPRTWEVTAGVEREIVAGVSASLDFVHRTFTNQYEQNETNRIWNRAGTGLETLGGYRNGRAETTFDLSTPDEATRRYEGVTVGLNKREGRLKANASYTWSELYGRVHGNQSNAWGDIPGRNVFMTGYLPDDHRHEIKLSLAYQATPWLMFGSRTTFMSGFPFDRLYRNDVTTNYENYNARRGFDPGIDRNDPADDRELRLPDQMDVNIQARVNLLPLIGQRLDFYVDVLNALAIRTVTNLGTNDGQDFGLPRTWMDPFRVRLGVNYKF